MREVYLDYAATTPLDARVFDAMAPYLKEHFGNASSVHALGRKARFAVEESRETVADLLGGEPGEIVFMSGGTEANNTVLRHLAASGKGLLTSLAEHESVLRPAEALHQAGYFVRFVAPGPTGALTAAEVAENLSDEVDLVSLMHANNELGTVTDIRTVIDVCRGRGILVHVDAVQTAGYGMIRVDEIDVDLVTVSGHKFHGPKGVGVLFVRGGVELSPLLKGGAQERGRRGGTENVAAIVGFAKAFSLALQSADEGRHHAAAMGDRLHKGLLEALGTVFITNTPLGRAPVVPHILNISFPPDGEPLDGEMLLLNLDMEGVRVSAGSACASGALEPSHVLQAIGVDRKTAGATIRFSVGRDTSEEDVDYAVEALARVMARMRPEFVVP